MLCWSVNKCTRDPGGQFTNVGIGIFLSSKFWESVSFQFSTGQILSSFAKHQSLITSIKRQPSVCLLRDARHLRIFKMPLERWLHFNKYQSRVKSDESCSTPLSLELWLVSHHIAAWAVSYSLEMIIRSQRTRDLLWGKQSPWVCTMHSSRWSVPLKLLKKFNKKKIQWLTFRMAVYTESWNSIFVDYFL